MKQENPESFDDRIAILKISLKIEHAISEYLAQLLKVKSLDASYSFGNKSSSLSFNHKVNLLIDINALENDAKKVLITFMEIRNQFMHNIKAKNFVLCVRELDGRESFLLKRYPQKSDIPYESQIEFAVTKLCEEAFNLTNSIVSVINDRIIDEAMGNVAARLMIATMVANETIRNEFNSHIDSLKEKTFTGEEVKRLYFEYSQKVSNLARSQVPRESDANKSE